MSGVAEMMVILWMDEILHHLETMGNNCLIVFYREIMVPGFLRWCLRGFRPSTVFQGRLSLKVYPRCGPRCGPSL